MIKESQNSVAAIFPTVNEKSKYQSVSQSFNQSVRQSVRNYRVPSSVEKDAALNSLFSRIESLPAGSITPFVFPGWAKRVAGIAAVLVSVISLWLVFSSRQVHNAGEEVISLRLPDQSRMVLAPGGSVSYGRFLLHRKVNLKGKGYFEVDKGNRFRVITPSGSVEVLGTRFMVDGEKSAMQVVCYQGKVKAVFRDNKTELSAGKGIRISENDVKVMPEEKNSYPAFARFRTDYRNASLENVTGDLGKFFGVEIDNRSQEKRFFSGSMDTGSLETALEILTGSLQMRYEIQNENKIIIY